MKKALREIVLSEKSTTIQRNNSNSSTIRITAGDRNYYLSTESSQLASEWMACKNKVFTITLLRHLVMLFISGLQAASATSISGWLVRTIGGSESRSWTVVKRGIIEFYERENDQVSYVDIYASRKDYP